MKVVHQHRPMGVLSPVRSACECSFEYMRSEAGGAAIEGETKQGLSFKRSSVGITASLQRGGQINK